MNKIYKRINIEEITEINKFYPEEFNNFCKKK